MIVKYVWLHKYKELICDSTGAMIGIHSKSFRWIWYEGWFLFGFIPLYVRPK